MTREIMMCERCHVPMNCHAEKPTEPCTAEEARHAERGIGMIEEVHRCKQCGDTKSRRMVV